MGCLEEKPKVRKGRDLDDLGINESGESRRELKDLVACMLLWP